MGARLSRASSKNSYMVLPLDEMEADNCGESFAVGHFDTEPDDFRHVSPSIARENLKSLARVAGHDAPITTPQETRCTARCIPSRPMTTKQSQYECQAKALDSAFNIKSSG
jgi:hypothetical protein